MSEPIISVSGLRGVVGESLTPVVAMRYACAFASTLPPAPVLISRDGRTTGPMIAAAIVSGLTAIGRDVLDANVVATPTVGVLVRQHQLVGGIQITASHNPSQYNGLKLFSAEGRIIPADAGTAVIESYQNIPPHWVPHDRLGRVHFCADTTSAHWTLIEQTVDVQRIKARRFKVLLDANHGAGSVLGRHLLEQLGCDVVVLGGDPDGQFAHAPEPTAENLASVESLVRDAGADVGFCQDPDADRLAVLDETGRYLGEEYTLAMCVEHVLHQRPGPVVINCSTSRMSEDSAERHGAPCFRSAVGEANVVDSMLAHGAVVGGEGNGGVIDPRVGLVRDSFVGMALLLDAMASRSAKVSQLADELPRYEIEKVKIALPREKVPAALAALRRHFSDAQSDTLDGLRLDWPGRWLLVRASNTEPVVRAIAEAETLAEARRLCAEAQTVMMGLA